MTPFERAIATFRVLAPRKRKFVLDYIRFMEGSWGDLSWEEDRRWHYRVLKECCPDSDFPASFEADMEERATHFDDPVEEWESKLLGDVGRSLRELRVEGLYRDFHYPYEEAAGEG